jgi:hypothetical protein
MSQAGCAYVLILMHVGLQTGQELGQYCSHAQWPADRPRIRTVLFSCTVACRQAKNWDCTILMHTGLQTGQELGLYRKPRDMLVFSIY